MLECQSWFLAYSRSDSWRSEVLEALLLNLELSRHTQSDPEGPQHPLEVARHLVARVSLLELLRE